MKTFVKILSMLVAVIMIVSVGAVGFSAYAEPSDVLGNYDFTVVDNPYANISWYEDNPDLHAFKSSTHTHTVRSDADIELNDTIWYHYMTGYEVQCITDHGTVNGVDIKEKGRVTGTNGANGASCGWTENQDRCALYAYQSFVHGNIDEITKDDYYNIIQGKQVGTYGDRPADLVAAGRGMFNLPLGNEANAVSGNKCHVNTYNVSVFHGATRNVEWPESTVQGAYNSGAFSRINHVGEWTDGNGDPSVYSASWVQDYALIFTRYCPNRDDYTESSSAWNTTNITNQQVKKGVIGMELVNTSDNRTRNDRFYVYDAALKILAPQKINVYGFCEDDSHEESDIDKNAQYFLVNDGTAWSEEDKDYYGSNYSVTNGLDPWVGYTGDILKSMTNGEFYACSVNSKNSYELGDGFVAVGEYPSLRYFNIDEETDQITLKVTNAAKVRLVADGTIVDTETIVEGPDEKTITFDLNSYEETINNYVRIYLTGKGGITYLQPILLSKDERQQSYVKFILPSADTTLEVYGPDKALIETEYYDNIYVLEPGEYTYKSTRRGYLTKEETFVVTQEDVDIHREREIVVTLDKDENVSYAYFYAPETIYLDPANNKDFLYYIDRQNEENGALIASPNKTQGNVYFHRARATDVKITASYQEGAAGLASYALETNSTEGDTISTVITSGSLSNSIANNEYVLITWQAEYKFEGRDYVSYTYSYVYPTPKGDSATLSAGARMVIDHDLNSALKVTTSVFAFGLHKVESAQSTGYEYAPYYKNIEGRDNDPYIDGGSGYTFRTNDTSGSSASAVASSADYGYIYADRSRINNFNEVPLLQIGFDINSAEKADETDTTPYYKFYFAAEDNVLASMSGSRLDGYDGKRIYISDNNSSDKKLNRPFLDQDEARYVVHGEAKGVHEVGPWLGEWMAQATSVSEVFITVIRTNKGNLREKYNMAVSSSYQQDWFPSIPEYNAYREAIIKAAKVLGNPGATPEEILDAERSLNQADDGANLNSGSGQVKHCWVYANETGVIKTETPFNFTLGDAVVVTTQSLDGYQYANTYERYAIISNTDKEGNVTEERKLVATGSDVYESLTAAEVRYEWIFYYTPITYKITYNTGLLNFTPNGGSGSVALYKQNFTICTNAPSREGYTFEGWYFDLDTSGRVYNQGETFIYNYLENGQFLAKWVPLEYKVSYDPNGGGFKEGEGPNDDELDVVYDETYQITADVPVRTGYNFLGWKVNNTGDIHTAGSQFVWDYAANCTLVAQWSNAEYEVTMKPVASDATVSPSTIKVEYDKPYGDLPVPVRTGYSYAWYSDPNYPDVSLVTSETIVKIPVNHELYAKWTPIDYSISYTLDGGLLKADNPTTYNIESESFTLNNPERTGYTFAGWSGTGIDSSSYKTEVTVPKGSYGNRTYSAHWTAIDYTITYDLNDDDPTASKADNSHNPTGFTYADAFTITPPERAGYKFKGWTGGEYTNAQSIDIAAGTYSENLTFEATWEEITYSIGYDLRGGTANANSPSQYTIEIGATIGAPTRVGYTFLGWQSSLSSEIESELVIEPGTFGDIILTAVWNSDEGEIIYNLNGGSFLTENPTTYKSGDSFPIENPIRTGYKFNGWTKYVVNTNKTQTGLMNAGIVGEGADADSGTVIFTATWTPLTYTITYNLDGGHYESAVTNNITEYTPETPTFTLTNPIKEGYIFNGWTGTQITGTSKLVTIQKGSIDNRGYKATWVPANYTITYDFAGGSATESCIANYTYETTSREIGAPIRTGYTFAGWEQTYQRFTWKTGELDNNGYYQSCENHYLSSPILVRTGCTYTMSANGDPNHVEAFLFDQNRKFIAKVNVGQNAVLEIPNADLGLTENSYFIYFVVSDEFMTAAVRDTIKIKLVDNSDALADLGRQETVSLPQGSTGNFTLTAFWDVIDYSLSYELDGGYYPQYDKDGNELKPGDTGYVEDYNPNKTTYNCLTEDFTLIAPTKLGYSFLGWEYDNATSTSVVIRQGSTGNRNYKAVWTETMYTISYDLGNGTVTGGTNPATYYSSTPDFKLYNPTRTGYTFGGWTGTDISGTSKDVTVKQGSTGNRSYVATWSPDTYSIIYDLAGGTNSPNNPNSYNYETETFTLSHPTKPGAAFSGWEGTDIVGSEMTVTVPKGSTGNRTYRAIWTNSTYRIAYNLAGGTNSSANPSTYTVADEITLRYPTRTGYNFTGWTGTNLTEPTLNVMIPKGSTGNKSYTANWSPVVYFIDYTLGSGAEVGIANPTSYTIESPSITLNNPERSGYIFTGWSGTGIEGTAQTVTIYKGSTGNRSYTANWEVESYDITYVLNGGEAIGNPDKYSVNSPTITLNKPTREGYNFAGWTGTGISGTGKLLEVIIPTGSYGDRIYTANWELITYTITYDLDGGKETIANPKNYTYNSSQIILHNPVKDGYDFLGWISTTEGEATPELKATIEAGSTGDKYFRAVWAVGDYNISYNLDGGSWPEGYTQIDKYKYADPTFTIPNPVKEGYTFAGWSGTGISGTTDELIVYTGSSGDREYTAHWAEGNNVITYDLDGGAIPEGYENPTSYVTDTGFIILNNPVKNGYRFKGWIGTDLDSATKEVVIDTSVSKPLSYTATWTPIDYKITYVLAGGELSSGVTNVTTYNVTTPTFYLNNPTREGYTFVGWMGTDLVGAQPSVVVIEGSTGARTYTAIWEETVYNISYDYGAGSVQFANPINYSYTTPTFALNNPTLTGYEFTGWTGTGLTEKTMNVLIEKGSTGPRSYVATYSINTYNLKFLGLEGAKFNSPELTYKVDTPDIVVPNPTKIGYIFNGWTGTGINGIKKDLVITKGSTGNKTYTANFSPIDYTVEYELNSGRVSGINPTSYNVESASFEVLDPGRAGFNFDGWTLSIVDFIWYNGTIDSNGNIVAGSGYYSMPVSLRADTTYTYDSSLKLAIFDTNGNFVELANSGSYTADADYLCSVVVAGDATDDYLSSVAVTVGEKVKEVTIPRGNMGSLKLTANWTSEKFTITYNLNGGALEEGVTNPTEYTAETTGFELKNPVRTGYVFAGWSGTGLTNAAVAVYVPAGATGNRVYTANWRIEKFYIEYVLGDNAHFLETVPEFYTSETPTFSLPIPVRSGYTFTGWLCENGEIVPTVTIKKGSTGARTFVAQWTENSAEAGTHRIYYHGFNNQLIGYQDVKIGTAPTGIAHQEVIGYKFVGWSVALDSPAVKDSEEDVHIYSKYTVGDMTYDITVTVGEGENASITTTTYTQYATVRVTAPETLDGKTFSHWEDGNGAVVSYYRTFSFKAHTDMNIVAVYGETLTQDKVSTRITKAEYNKQHEWISFYAERSVASEYRILQHGILFTGNAELAKDSENFVLGTNNRDICASTASSTTRSGVYTLSIGGLLAESGAPYAGAEKLYARSYITYVDANNVTKTVYSDIPAEDVGYVEGINCFSNLAQYPVSSN